MVFCLLRFVACASIKQNWGKFVLLSFPRFVTTTLNTKKETAANFFNQLRNINKEQHAHFIHSYKSRQSE